MVRPLLLIGAGGFGREVVEAVRAVNEARPTWDLLGFLDDGPSLVGAEVDGVPVLGGAGEAARFPEASFVVCTGSPANYFSRKRLVRRLALPPERFATIIHPGAHVAGLAEIGPGTALLATAVVTSRARVGAHVAVMPGVVVTHDDEVGDFVTMAAGAKLAGGVRVDEGAYVGAGALVRENLSIGAWSLVGMGSVVTHSVPACQVWAGVPARRLRAQQVPEDVREAALTP